MTRSQTQHRAVEPERVFPLPRPMRKADRIEGRDPLPVIRESGRAEADCIFVTVAQPDDAIWSVTRYEPARGLVEMPTITPRATACRLIIELRRFAAGTDATVADLHTSLGPQGDACVAGFTEAFHDRFVRDRDARLKHDRGTGQRPRAGGRLNARPAPAGAVRARRQEATGDGGDVVVPAPDCGWVDRGCTG